MLSLKFIGHFIVLLMTNADVVYSHFYNSIHTVTGDVSILTRRLLSFYCLKCADSAYDAHGHSTTIKITHHQM